MFDKIKKEKQQKANRNALRMFPHLLIEPASSIMVKSYPNITSLNLLRASTNMHLNYIIFSYIEALQRANALNEASHISHAFKSKGKNPQAQTQMENKIGVENIKIGIIGGGIMGRLFLNSLLVLQKDGILGSNLMLSTRQSEDLQSYTSMFQVNVGFDNQKIASQADIIIITSPATLDNWVVMDLKQVLQSRINASPTSNNNQKRTNNLNPLVYITTSNMTRQKLAKLFDFPIISPFVRGHETKYMQSLTNESMNWKGLQPDAYVENLEKYIEQKVRGNVQEIKQALSFAFEKYLTAGRDRKYSTINQSDRNSKSGKTIIVNQKVLPVQSKTQRIQKSSQKQKHKQQQKQSQKGESKKSSMNLSNYSNSTNNHNSQLAKSLIQQIMAENNNTKQTFLKRCRKWRMAYNNFIA